MKNTLLYMKNKIWGFRLIFFTFFMIFAIIAKLPFSHALEDTQSEERKLVDIFPNIYATLMDENGKIVSTTNPNKEVDELYKYTDEVPPEKYLMMDDKLYLVIDANVEIDSKENINVLEDVYYELDLPSQIIPDNSLIVHNRDDELELLKLGKTKAFGGIYGDENNNYHIKVRFNDVDEVYQLKLTYKILYSFNDNILDQISDFKTITINGVGNLNFYLKSMEKTKYELIQTLDNNYVSKDLYNLTTTLIDTRTESDRVTKGRLFIDLGADFGFNNYSSESYLNRIKIYANGDLLSPIGKNNSPHEAFFSNDKIKITMKVVNYNQNIFISGYSYLVNGLEVFIENNEGDAVTGVQEIKIVLPEKITTTKLGVHSNYASYEDYLDNNKIINTTVSVNDESSKIALSTLIENENFSSDEYIPSELTHSINISKSPSNFVKIDIDNELLDLDINNFQYFFNTGCMNQGGYPSCISPSIFIDGKKVNFLTNNGISYSSFTSGHIQPSDGQVLLQIKEILGDEINRFERLSNNSILRSETVNADGEYYYILWSYDAYDAANKTWNKGRTEFANIVNKNNDINKIEFNGAPNLTMYLFNISNRDIKLTFDYLLSKITRTEFNNQNNGKYLSLTTSVSNDYNYYNNSTVTNKDERSANYNKYMTVNGEIFANDFIKWNVIIDTKEIALFNHQLNRWADTYIFLNIPPTQSIDQSAYLLNEDRFVNKIPQGSTSYKDYLAMNAIHIGEYNPISKSCGNLSNTFASILNSNKEDSLFIGSSDDIYYSYRGSLKEFIHNDKLCLVFFTKSSLTSGDDKVKVEFDVTNNGRLNHGSNTTAITYEAEGAINRTNKGNKSIETIDDKNDIIKWKYIADLTSDDKTCYDSSSEATLPYLCKKEKAYYNGMFTFSDNITGVIADYTYLDKIDVNIKGLSSDTTISMTKDEFDDVENKKCNSDGVCISVSFYPTIRPCLSDNRTESCYTSFYGTDYLSKLKKMSNGFTLLVTGIKDGENIIVDYDTWSDSYEFFSNYDGPLLEFGYSTINNIVRNHWWDTKYNGPVASYDFLSTVSFTKKIDASLSIEKTIPDESHKKNITGDSIENIKLNVISGYSPVEYLKIVDRITGVKNVELLNDANSLTDIRDNLIIENLVIKYKNHSGNEEIVYQNGQFTNEWSNSTIKLNSSDFLYNSNDNSINLYSLYLKNNNHLLEGLSTVNISYDLILDMDNYSHENDSSYRNSNNYNHGKIYLSTDAYAVRPYDSNDMDNSSVLSSNNRNYVDYENNELYCFTSNNISSLGYLKFPLLKKQVVTFFDGILSTYNNSYSISYNSNSTGKEEKPTFNLTDSLTVDFALSGRYENAENNKKVDRLNELLLDKTNIFKFKIYDKNNDIVYEQEIINDDILDKPINNENINGLLSIRRMGEFIGIWFLGNLDKYDDIFEIKYETKTNMISFLKTAMEENLIDNQFIITGTNIKYQPRFKNDVINSGEEEIKSTVQSGYISLKALSPIISKEVSYPSPLEQTWTLKTNTGYIESPISIKDIMSVSPDSISDLAHINGNNDIVESIIVDNLIIKINDEIIYENNIFKDGYQDVVNINIEKLNLELTFKNSDSVNILGQGNDIKIIYNTKFDPQKYYDLTGKSAASYTLNNSVVIERDNLIGSNTVSSKKISYDYPLDVNKSNENKGNNLTTSLWKIEISSPIIDKKNITVSDLVTLSDSFEKYLSLSNMVITLVGEEEKVLFDYKNGIKQLPSGYILKDKLVGELEFNKNGEFEFILGIDELKANNKLVIEYELSIDSERYRYDNKPTGVLLHIFNKLHVLDGDDEYEVSQTGNNVVESTLSKKYHIVTISNGVAIIAWNIDVNLDVDYDGKIKEDDIVEIKDELYASLKYVDNSLEVYRKVFNGTDYSKTKLQKDVDYNFEYVDNTIKIRILNPVENSNILIEFNTDAVSTEGLKNYVTLSVKNEEIHANTEEVVPLFLKYIGGIVTSRQAKFYTIYANKYLDNELSSTIFKFKLEEVDYDGDVLEDGLKLIVQNDIDGKISFGPIMYSKVGTYYYRISEINDNKDYVYDSNTYILKTKVAEYNNSYLIENVEILNYDGEEINFYNKTIEKEPIVEPSDPIEPEEQTPVEPSNPIEPEEHTSIEPNKPKNEDIPDDLKTGDNIIYSFIVFYISIGILICLFVYLTKYKKKSI